MNKRGRWKDHGHWQCLAHVPPITLPASAERCWMVRCSERPLEDERPEEVDTPPAQVPFVGLPGTAPCAFDSCTNAAREGSKYCSRACSNRNARKRFKMRKAA